MINFINQSFFKKFSILTNNIFTYYSVNNKYIFLSVKNYLNIYIYLNNFLQIKICTIKHNNMS